jgi:hypothetical protein
MTPKEKAEELVHKFYDYADSNYGTNRFEQNWYGNVLAGERKVRKKSAKQCALIAVDEILKGIVPKDDDERYAFELGGNQFYWEEVKKEIELL